MRYLLVVAVLLTGCTEIELGCEAAGVIQPLCGIPMPEDLATWPDEAGLVVSEYGDMGKLTGALGWLSMTDGRHEYRRFLDNDGLAALPARTPWGDPDCQRPVTLSPHGIHLSRRGEAQQLLVVNHGARESVLFLEIRAPDGAAGVPVLAWRGCVEFPERAVLNDVAALPDGGFAVTHMYDRRPRLLAMLGSVAGLVQGHVWRWSPGRGLDVIPGSEAGMPNGIEVAPEGDAIWVNNYTDGEVRQFLLTEGRVGRRVPVHNIDNSAWLPDGRLLIASHTGSTGEILGCLEIHEGSCGAPFELVALDPQTGAVEVIFAHAGGGPFGPATVAVPWRGRLYAGSYSGDRIGVLSVAE
jgi:hypothetical protein